MDVSLRSHDTESIRNIAILGHAGSGKTTLIEALLAKAGEIRSAGSVEKGSTVCDFTAQEKRLRHSLDVHVCHLRQKLGDDWEMKPVLEFSAAFPTAGGGPLAASARNTVLVAVFSARLYILRLPSQRGALLASGRNTPM